MKRKINIWRNLDWLTIFIYLILVLIGWINIYAAVYNEEHYKIFDLTQRYGKQMLWIIAAILLIIIILIIESKFYSFFAYMFYGITILLLIIVLLFGKEVHGAKSWIDFLGFRIQPSEFAKFATSLALAKYLSSYNFKIYKLKSLIRIAVILFLPISLILLQNDTGSALVYFALILVLFREGLSVNYLIIFFLIAALFLLALIFNLLTIQIILGIVVVIFYWFNRKSFKEIFILLIIFIAFSAIVWFINYYYKFNIPNYLISLIGLGISSIVYLILAYKQKIVYIYFLISILFGSIIFTFSVDYFFNNILEPHQQKRINILLGIESDPLGDGYNINQSKIAIGSGGLTGKGFLQGTQTKYDFVPEQSTDFIFCTVGEEWGFIGTTTVILLFLFLFLRLIFIAERQRSAFSRIYCYGVISVLFFHVLINIGMTIGLTPVIGIPLPFFSYGGSSLWGFTILLFIFLRLDASRTELLL